MSNQPNFASRLASTWVPKNQPTWNRSSVVLNDHVLEMLISLGPLHQIMRKNLCYLHITSVNARAHTDVKSQCHAPFNHPVIFSCFQKATFYRNMLWNIDLCQQVITKWIWVNLPIRIRHWTRTMNTPTSLMYCGLGETQQKWIITGTDASNRIIKCANMHDISYDYEYSEILGGPEYSTTSKKCKKVYERTAIAIMPGAGDVFPNKLFGLLHFPYLPSTHILSLSQQGAIRQQTDIGKGPGNVQLRWPVQTLQDHRNL